MNKVPLLMIRLLVVGYYQQNSGLLFFIFLLSFGMIPPQYLYSTHYALILAQLSSPLLTAIVFILWLLYAARGIRFFRQTLDTYWDTVSHLLPIIGWSKLLVYLFISFALVFLPVLIYSALVALVAIQNEALSYGIYIIFSQLILLFGGTLSIYSLFTKKSLKIPTLSIQAPVWLKKHASSTIFYTLLIRFYWHEKKASLLFLKVVSYVSFHIFILRNAEFFRADYFSIYLLLVGFFHSLLIFAGHKHLEERALFLRNLPILSYRRGWAILLAGFIIYLPELLMLIGMRNENISFGSRLMFYLLLVTQFSLLFSLLYSENFSFSKFILYLFVIFFGYQVVVALVPLWSIILINLGFSVVIFYEGFPQYEYQSGSDE